MRACLARVRGLQECARIEGVEGRDESAAMAGPGVVW